MKPLIFPLCCGLAVGLSACAFNDTATMLQAIGPAPMRDSTLSSQGALVVYSAWDPLANRYARDHTSYDIASDDGKFSRQVQNHMDRSDEDPARVFLPPGNYHVTARSSYAGLVIVPVVIQGGRTTVVYLDGSTGPSPFHLDKKNLVRFPNGEIVGWSANAAAK